MRLAEITAEIAAIDAALEESGGEISDAVAAALKSFEDQLDEKIDSVCQLLRWYEATAHELRTESRRLADRAISFEKRGKGLRHWVMSTLLNGGISRVKTPRNTVWVAKTGNPTVTWTEAEPIPMEYAKITTALDTAAVRRSLKDGTLPDGFKVEYFNYLCVR